MVGQVVERIQMADERWVEGSRVEGMDRDESLVGQAAGSKV